MYQVFPLTAMFHQMPMDKNYILDALIFILVL